MRRRWVAVIILASLIAASGCQHRQFEIAPGVRGVDLLLRVPYAKTVQIVSSSRQFAPLAANEIESGQWHVNIPENVPFRFYYLIDGHIFMPDCRQREMDDFGSQNCIYDPGTYLPDKQN